MVKEYLEKTRDQLLEERISILERETALQNHLKENIKFIQLLEETNDPNFASFTPREVNGYNNKKLDELKLDQKETEEKIANIKNEIGDITMKIDEVNSVLRVANEEENDSSSGKNKITILETQEKERQRIARDLHDSTVQNLTSLVHKSELCMKLMDIDPIRCRLELSSLSKTLRDIIEDTRNMIYDLRPMSFDDIGFDITVERYLDKMKSNNPKTSFQYRVVGDPYAIKSVVSLTLLRVIQEACSNAVKHAKAEHVTVSLSYKNEGLLLDIIDDGNGFDLSTIPEFSRDDNSGFGLSMMKERIYLLSGTINFESEPGKGFHIIVNIPIKEEDK